MEKVLIEPSDDLAIVRLNNGVTNAVNLELVEALSSALRTVSREFSGMVLAGGEKFFSIGLSLPELLKLDRSDMTDFELNKKFNLILMTGIAFAHLETREEIEGCLSCVKHHLTDNGRFIFDFFNPSLTILTRNPSEQFPHAEYPDPDGNGKVTITESNKYDSATQINKLQLHFKLGEREESHSVNMRMFFPQELDALLYYNGFEIEHKYGGYNGQPFDSDSGLQIVICKLR